MAETTFIDTLLRFALLASSVGIEWYLHRAPGLKMVTPKETERQKGNQNIRDTSYLALVSLSNSLISTYIDGGRLHHHLVHFMENIREEGEVEQVTVIAKNCWDLTLIK